MSQNVLTDAPAQPKDGLSRATANKLQPGKKAGDETRKADSPRRRANVPVEPTPTSAATSPARGLPPRKTLKTKRFVALAGNIGAGKTTAAKLISQSMGFELFDEPVIDNRFLKAYYSDMKRWSFTLQLEFLIRRVEHHELIHTVKKSCVQDRTLYEDPEIFAKYLHGLGNLGDTELELYFDYFKRLTRNIIAPDKVICFDVPDVNVLLSRIRVRGREEEKGIQNQFLRGLNGYYASFPVTLQNKYGIDTLVLDVTTLDIRTGRGREEFLDQVSTFLAR